MTIVARGLGRPHGVLVTFGLGRIGALVLRVQAGAASTSWVRRRRVGIAAARGVLEDSGVLVRAVGPSSANGAGERSGTS